MADMNAIVALQKAERLVSTIARAFYTDITVLVVDTLIREKYIKDKDEELGSRLNLQPKQVRSALAELLAEGFAAKEMMSDEIYSGRSSNYWYIDLRHAVNVILLRVFQMKEILSQRQEAKAAHQARDKNQPGNLVQCGPCDSCSTLAHEKNVPVKADS
ncbi:conserved unknown protein [Ectocarpus siliculosus]|uniref:HTH TFE/IIEalpha-type domain-containing protein n=1 Tax=Ectocarpus siliculosus TaxID=2880 RepID=D8LCF1_ECTSI|nr:conserved unknown protein [Ectocarpus siliculosus]|eukprot:CBN78187.1 conserved unknown protein [Ectocarpus siliculosus]